MTGHPEVIPGFRCSGGQHPAAGNHPNGLFVKVLRHLTEFQEMNLSASITRD
jgi:hypothetical protein